MGSITNKLYSDIKFNVHMAKQTVIERKSVFIQT